MTKAEFIGALARLEAELADGTPLKVAVLDDPHRERCRQAAASCWPTIRPA